MEVETLAEPVLGGAAFWQGPPGDFDGRLPFAIVPLRVLEGEAVTIWQGTSPVEIRRSERVTWASDGTLLLGVVQVPLGDVREAARDSYLALFECVDSSAAPHLYRIWNYIPHITSSPAGREVYRQFNIGRHDAFMQRRATTANPPAACALGSHVGFTQLFFLAGKHPGTPVENPRQVSAYAYPSQYGPRSPTFSRGLLAPYNGKQVFFISGTASITGHETQHAGDVVAQTRETVTNLQTMMAEAIAKGFPAQPGQIAMNAYLRRAEDVGAVKAILSENFPGIAVTYLQADICRPDLLVEVEATLFE